MADDRRRRGVRRSGRGTHATIAAAIALTASAAGAQAQAQTAPPASAQGAAPAAPARKGPPQAVAFYGSPTSPISGGVAIPAGAAFVWTSGTVPPVVKPDAPAGDIARFGDTKTQAIGVLEAIEAQLAGQGLTMADVVYLRAYLVADPAKGAIDTEGWNAGYREFFGTAANPTKPARSTVGVAALVNKLWLIEIEAFAVYPAAKP